MAENRKIMGLNVSAMAREEAAALLQRQMRDKTPVRLAFVNANLANLACDDTNTRTRLGKFLLLNDGAGVNLASRLLYRQSFPDNLNGTDFTPYFLDQCSTPLRLYLLGASPAVSARTAEYFTRRWPQHTLVGHQHGFFHRLQETQILAQVSAAKPDLVLVALGNGLQERWIEQLVPQAALSAWGVGALFDFLCGEVRRAPLWMRRLGLEWLYRLLQEPGRMWRRYVLGNPLFVLRLLREFVLRAWAGRVLP